MNIGFPKISRAARRLAKHQDRVELRSLEDAEKRKVRRRDGHHCRFPLCGCRKLRLRLEASHCRHKGIGGNPAGDRSKADGMILLCVHRHQEARISIHKGTLRARPLTHRGMDGPVLWEADGAEVLPPVYQHVDKNARWIEVARESSVQQLEPLTLVQHAILTALARMES